MALHTPVVATQKGAEGIEIHEGGDILIADKPQDFAEKTLQLLSNSKLRQKISDNAYQLVNEKYNWAKAIPSFLDLVDKTARI